MPEFFNFSIGSSRSTILFYVQASLLSPVPLMGRFPAYWFHALSLRLGAPIVMENSHPDPHNAKTPRHDPQAAKNLFIARSYNQGQR